jgi:hypothetical protein
MADMVTDRDWQDRVKRILKAELTRRDVSYRALAEKLGALGIHETERNISNKIGRAGFSAVWFFQVMDAIGARVIHLDRDQD